jgi:hypothetical protein
MNVSIYPDSPRRVGASSTGDSGNGNVDNRADFESVVSFLRPRPTIVPMVSLSFCNKNETESIAAAQEQSALHSHLAANASHL